MQQFANKFRIFLNQDKTEAIINFYQEIPAIPDTPQRVEGDFPTTTTPVASLAMTGKCAHNLLASLGDLLNRT